MVVASGSPRAQCASGGGGSRRRPLLGAGPLPMLLLAVLLALLLQASPTLGARVHRSRLSSSRGSLSAHSSSSSSRVPSSVLLDALAQAQEAADMEAYLNRAPSSSHKREALYADSDSAHELQRADAELTRSSGGAKVDALSFLQSSLDAAAESDPLAHVDVEGALASIDSALAGVLPAGSGGETDLGRDIMAHLKAGANQRQAVSRAPQQQLQQRRSMRARAAQALSPSQQQSSPSARRSRLVASLDAYRSARGHAEAQAESADVSALELRADSASRASAASAAQTESQSRAHTQHAYSLPSAFAPAMGPVGPPVAVAPAAAGVAPLGAWSALGLTPAAVAAVAPAVAAEPSVPPASIAGVSVLLQALRKVQEEQATASLMAKLSNLIAAQAAANQAQAAQTTPFASPYPLQPAAAPAAAVAQPAFDPFSYGPNPLSGAPATLAPVAPVAVAAPAIAGAGAGAFSNFFMPPPVPATSPSPVSFNGPIPAAALPLQDQLLPQNLHAAQVTSSQNQPMAFPQ